MAIRYLRRWGVLHRRSAIGSAHLVLSAMPSALASYNDAQANLGVQLNATSGLIHLYDYFSTGSSSSSSSSSAGAGGAPGYLADEKVKQGSSGTPILLRRLQLAADVLRSLHHGD